MTQSVYIIGGAGTGKSTFTSQLMDRYVMSWEVPLTDLAAKPNSRGTVITLRGHRLAGYQGEDGMYLGVMRDSFPGTDGLDRVSYIPGEAWLEAGNLPDFIIAEGATLAARRFIRVLHETTDLLLVHLEAEDFVKDLRLHQRGSEQAETFVTGTATRSKNLAVDMAKEGVKVWTFDSAEPLEWDLALDVSVDHLR